MEKTQEIERCLITNFRRRIYSKFVSAVKKYSLIEEGDRIAVCISGGKDSFVMAKCLQELKRHGVDNFDLVYLVMDPGYKESDLKKITDNADLLGLPIQVFSTDIFKIATSLQDGSPCYLCARMRRGALYSQAKSLGCNKIALGHHYDDIIETTMMGILYNGQVQTMLPKCPSDNFENMSLIRPMCLVRERDVIAFSAFHGLDFIRCACPMTGGGCASGEGKRAATKKLIAELEKQDEHIPDNIFKSVSNVHLGGVYEYKDKNGVRHKNV